VEEELAVRALWLAYIGKYTQDKIARYLNISRQKVQRLIAEGIARDYMTVQICHDISSLIELEERLKSTYGLEYAQVVPRLPGEQSAETYMESLGLVGSTYLINLLSGPESKTIGIGWGRTISHVAKGFYKRAEKKSTRHQFVPLMGSLSSNSAMNPMNLIYLFGEKTNAETYFMPAPFLVDSIEQRVILEQQKSVQKVLNLASTADHYFISIGEVGSTSSVLKFGLISQKHQKELLSQGAVADVLGKFIDKNAELVDHPINQLSITVDIETLRKKSVTAVCSGLEKIKAVRTVLEAKLISGLITDEETAGNLLGSPIQKQS
jgi:DNA-binding transcriptional regulator LsrR (DeoR family)